MKKYIIAILLSVFVLIIAGAALQTTATQLRLVRADGGEDFASAAAVVVSLLTAGDAGNRSATAWDIGANAELTSVNAPKFYFAAEAADKTFGATCVAYAATNGPGQIVCTIAATTGNQEMVKWPNSKISVDRFWVDEVVVTSYWPKTVTVGSSGGGDNGVACLWFDGMGSRYYKWYIWTADGTTGTEAANVSVWGAYF